MTTVGFIGDVPSTTLGALLSGVLMILGFVVLAVTTAGVASLFVRENEAPFEESGLAFEQEALAELRALNRRVAHLEAELVHQRSGP